MRHSNIIIFIISYYIFMLFIYMCIQSIILLAHGRILLKNLHVVFTRGQIVLASGYCRRLRLCVCVSVCYGQWNEDVDNLSICKCLDLIIRIDNTWQSPQPSCLICSVFSHIWCKSCHGLRLSSWDIVIKNIMSFHILGSILVGEESSILDHVEEIVANSNTPGNPVEGTLYG